MSERENDTMGGMRTEGGFATPEALTMSGLETLGGDDGHPVLAGRYRVVRRLGEGGMGSVWLAEDLKLDGKPFAIKMLPAVLAGKKGAYRQVKAEAVVAMKLSHPNIATVRAFEEDEGGQPFLVMDYIEGEGLDDILAERGPLGEEETRRVLGPVAAALDYAHSQGVVHRDVKPGNVMVRKDGTPFVLDFGIAREIQETMTLVTGKLSSGTLLYMSPEQLHGRAPKAAQDVYSFAAMAYECLTGNPPFSRGQIEYQIDHDEPEPLAEGTACMVLRAGIMAGLSKEPEKRPGTCAGVLENGGASEAERRWEAWRRAQAEQMAAQRGREAQHRAIPRVVPEVRATNGRSNTVTVVGYGGKWQLKEPTIKIFIDGNKVGEVKADEVKNIHIDGPCKLEFKYALRSAECFVNGGEYVLLSLSQVTGSLRAILTESQNYQRVLREKEKSDAKWGVLTLCLLVVAFIIKACT